MKGKTTCGRCPTLIFCLLVLILNKREKRWPRRGSLLVLKDSPLVRNLGFIIWKMTEYFYNVGAGEYISFLQLVK